MPQVASDEALCHPERSEAELKDLAIEWNPCPATAYALTALCTAAVLHLRTYAFANPPDR